VTRRHFFEQASFGIGGLALASLMDGVVFAEAPGQASSARPLHFAPKVKRVIYLFMAGAPSQIDLFDPKPALTRHDGEDIPEEFIKGERFAFIKGTPKLLASPFQFRKHGQSGAELSELLPNLAKVADDIAIVRSMSTSQFNHAPAQIFMNTGHQVIGRPSLGSWLSYGLGSENSDLPAFIVLLSGENNPMAASRAGAAASFRRLTRGWNSDRAASRFSSLPTRKASTATCAAGRSRPSTISTGSMRSTSRIPRSRRASPPTSWRIGCRPASPS
jgi:hypothetical protein